MFKKGLSDVITTVLIILLVLAAVVLVWGFIRNNLTGAGEQIEASSFGLGGQGALNIIPQSVLVNEGDNSIKFVIKRDSGESQLQGALITLKDEDDKIVTYRWTGNIASLGTTSEIIVNYTEQGLEKKPVEINVAPIFKSSTGKEIIGDLSIPFIIKNESYSSEIGGGDENGLVEGYVQFCLSDYDSGGSGEDIEDCSMLGMMEDFYSDGFDSAGGSYPKENIINIPSNSESLNWIDFYIYDTSCEDNPPVYNYSIYVNGSLNQKTKAVESFHCDPINYDLQVIRLTNFTGFNSGDNNVMIDVEIDNYNMALAGIKGNVSYNYYPN